MDDAGLHDRRRKYGGDSLRKSLQAIDDGNQNVLDAAVLEFGHDAQPEFGAFRGLDPKAQDVLGSFRYYGANATSDLAAISTHLTLYLGVRAVWAQRLARLSIAICRTFVAR
jgi:hypothetical protein